MSHSQTSATGELKRNAGVFTVAFVGVGTIMHFAVPWFDFLQAIGWIFSFAADFPKAAAIPVAFAIVIFLMAAVSDRFRQ